MSQTACSRILLLGTEVTYSGTPPVASYGIVGVTAGTSIPIARPTDDVLSFYLRSIGTTSGGTILIEEAEWGPWENPYSGTWSQVASISASAFTGGAQTAYHITSASYGYVRVRISSAITGGGSIIVALLSRGAA